ncbi:hypothetical protein ACGFX4_38885 [Kitasatospora sp. NPDC048365]|uniref:hypothetical protein n=1 Tax=Kitasatospora sp. NPDC048365 TaxID=3364050 RepID=UPI003718A380
MAKALVAGVGHLERYIGEEDQADGAAVFGKLPAVTEAAKVLASALERAGVSTGEALLECTRDTFTRSWNQLQEHAGADEPLILHFTGHGVTAPGSGTLYLATADGDARPGKLDDTCVSTQDLLTRAENAAYDSGRPVLFLLDVCGAGQAVVQQQLTDLATRRRQDGRRNVWIIGACANDAVTYGARFTAAVAETLRRLADFELDISPAQEYVPVSTLAQAINRQLAATDRACGHPGQDIVHTPHASAAPETPAFFRNPAHSKDPQAGLLTGMNPWLREFALACSPGLDPLHFATRAAGEPHVTDFLFSGRTSHLRRIEDWNRDTGADPANRLLVVTGSPGSGKSALLGITACLLHPELTPLIVRVARVVPEGFALHSRGRVLAVHARQLTLQAITDSLVHQLRLQHTPTPGADCPIPPSLGQAERMSTADLVRELNTTGGDTLVILDALDEADDPAAVLNQLLLPLTTGSNSGCRAIIGTRPWWDTLPALHQHLTAHPEAKLDTDPSTARDRLVLADDLATYLGKLLPLHDRDVLRDVGDRLAHYSDHGAFLVAALYADHLSTTPDSVPADAPCSVTEVFDLHTGQLAAADPWIRPVLTALGHARGQGMPLDLLHAAALAHQPPAPGSPTPQLADTRRVLTKTAFYLRTAPDTDHRLLYRYFHQALTDHTRRHADPATLHQALLDTIPSTPTGAPKWQDAQPYLLSHAAAHAAAAGDHAVDRLLEDPIYLLHADPDTLTPHLNHAHSQQAQLHAHIYRTTTAHDPRRHMIEARRGLLAIDAVAWQHPDFAHTVTRARPFSGAAMPTARWATRRTHPARLHTLNHAGEVISVAVAAGPHGPLAITTSNDKTAIVWNPVTGQRLHTLEGHTGRVRWVAVLDGPQGPLAITTSWDCTAIVWNLITGQRLHILEDHAEKVHSVAVLDGPQGPLAITTSWDYTAIVWNPITGQRLHTLEGHTYWAQVIVPPAVAVATGREGPIAITTSYDRTAIVWDPTTGQRLRALRGHTDLLTSVAVAAGPEGLLAITTSYDCMAIVWNPVTGQRLRTLEGHTDWLTSVTVATGPKGLLAITTSTDGSAIVWNPVTGQRLHTLEGHTGPVGSVAVLDGPHGRLAITTGFGPDHTAIVWNPTIKQLPQTLEGHAHKVTSVAVLDGSHSSLAITTSYDGKAIVWNPTTGQRLHTLEGHTGPVTSVAILDRPHGPLAITTGWDWTAIVWNPITGQRLHTLEGHTDKVNSVAVAAGPHGSLAITAGADGNAIVWNLTTGQRLRTVRCRTGPFAVEVDSVAVAVGPKGPLAIITSSDGKVIVWNPITGQHPHNFEGHSLKGRARRVNSVAVTVAPGPDGPLAITKDWGGKVIVWNPVTGQHLRTLKGRADLVDSVAVAVAAGPDGPLAITTSWDGKVIVWNLTTGRYLRTLKGHTGPVRCVVALEGPDGPLAMTTGDDCTAIVWNPTTGQAIHRIYLPHPAQQAAACGTGFLVLYGPETAYIDLQRTKAPRQ